MRNVNITLDVYATGVTFILLVVCMFQSRQNKEINKYLIGWDFSQILLFLCDIVRLMCRGKIERLSLFTVSFHLEFALCHLCLAFFHYYIIDYLHRKIGVSIRWRFAVWPIAILMPLIWIMSGGTRLFYVITYNAVNVSMDYYYLSQVPAMILIVFDMLLVFAYVRDLGWSRALQLAMFMSFPLIAFPLQMLWNAGVLFIGMTLSLLSRYMSISAEQTAMLARSRERLAESRVAITLNQIQPHFLYNALGSISALCEEDPMKARDATEHFAGYLRMNLESMNLKSPIHFERELDHILTYIWLERMRFGDQIKFEQEIKEKDFMLPALSVQPLVENAVKHGICSRQSGGTVTLSTYRKNNEIIISVKDDGVGFDTGSTDGNEDGKLHIGIQNVRSRLAMMVGGELEINSEIGRGTTAIIRIPAGGSKNENSVS